MNAIDDLSFVSNDQWLTVASKNVQCVTILLLFDWKKDPKRNQLQVQNGSTIENSEGERKTESH